MVVGFLEESLELKEVFNNDRSMIAVTRSRFGVIKWLYKYRNNYSMLFTAIFIIMLQQGVSAATNFLVSLALSYCLLGTATALAIWRVRSGRGKTIEIDARLYEACSNYLENLQMVKKRNIFAQILLELLQDEKVPIVSVGDEALLAAHPEL